MINHDYQSVYLRYQYAKDAVANGDNTALAMRALRIAAAEWREVKIKVSHNQIEMPSWWPRENI